MVLIGVALAGAALFVALYWWSEGAVEASDAVLLAVVFSGLIFGLFAANHMWQRLLAFVPLSAALAYAVYDARAGSVRSFYRARCKDYVAAICSDPYNLAAREHLADALYQLGELDRAMDEIQVAADMGAGMECQYKLGKWSKERYFRDTPNPICRRCQTENEQGARACAKCGSDLPYHNALSRWLSGGRNSSARCYLILITGAAVSAVSFAVLPLRFAFIPIGLCLMALIGWLLLVTARS